MSNQHQVITCQRCGRGFVLTPSYRDFLARRGAKVLLPMLCVNCFLKTGPLPKQHGKVKWFNPRKHYGFIVTGEGQEIFFHQSELVEDQGSTPLEGQGIRFHVRHSVKGPEALNVELVKEQGA